MNGAIVFIFILLIGALGVLVYGHLTQNETITVEVVDKLSYTTTAPRCTKSGDVNICVPITTTHWQVISPSEKFFISQALYEQVQIGKKHTFYVTGWPGNRDIAGILE